VHGEAGVGKTALLNEAFGSVPDMRVVRAAGSQSRHDRRDIRLRLVSQTGMLSGHSS
jgi:predicted ATPase